MRSSVGHLRTDTSGTSKQGLCHLLLAYLRTRLTDRHPPPNAAQRAFPWRAFTFHHSVTFDSSSDCLLVLASPVRVHFGFTVSRGYGMAGPRRQQFADMLCEVQMC